jgi:hypothetical protein
MTTTKVHQIKLHRAGLGWETATGFFRVRPWADPADPSKRWGWHLFIDVRGEDEATDLRGILVTTVGTLAEIRDRIATIYADAEATPGSSLYAAALRCRD